MATTILRPDAIIGEVLGWAQGSEGFISDISDNTNETSIVQSRTSCNATVSLQNAAAYSGGTITSWVVSITGNAGRAGASTVAFKVINSSGTVHQDGSLQFGGGVSTQTGDVLDASELSPSAIDDLRIQILPNTQGITIQEVFLTLTFTAAPTGYGHKVNGIPSANISKVILVATANVSKVNNV